MEWFNGKDAQLQKAIDLDSPRGVEEAVRAGADSNAKGQHDITPLMYAVGHFRKAAYKALLYLGADTAQRDAEGDNAITLAVDAYQRDPDFLLLAIHAGGDPNTRRADNDPILIRFINERNLPAIRMMKEAGADIDARNRSHRPLIVYAGLIEFWDVVWCLLELGARFDYADEPFTMTETFNSPKVTPPDSPLYPPKVKVWQFLRDHGVRVPASPGGR
jgi:hypothetical protein